jgi:coenzyme F420-reducing hydrogenase alpha subunit
MTGAVDPGSVTIDVAVAHGRVCSVRIQSTRPTNIARLFVGRSVDDIPGLAERVFSLCGRSHRLAAARAAAAAFERPVDQARRTADVIGLAAERIAETLRGTVLGEAAGAPVDPAVTMLLREALSAARTLMMHGLSERKNKNGSVHAPALVARLSEAMHQLGVPPASPNLSPDPRTPIGHLLQQAEGETAFLARTPDMLTEADDLDVVDALRMHGETFAATPVLPGRVAETGAYARHWQSTATAATALAARLHARLVEMVESLDLLQAAVTTGVHPEADPVNSGKTGLREGFAALESPRGRLYHWLRASAERQVTAYAILVPTEWNFHPRGPLLEAPVGAETGTGEEARRRISRLVAVFDPCVSFDVRVQEAADA